MRKNAVKGDLYTTEDRPYATAENEMEEGKGNVIDLVLPILVLIVCCIIGMIYTGGFFQWNRVCGKHFREVMHRLD